LAEIFGAGVGREPGHRESSEPYRGEGLSAAFREAFAHVPRQAEPVRTVYLSLNGESFWAKEWGVGHLRFHSRFAEALRIEHPAENFGDPGAGAGPLMVGMAALGLSRGYRQGPCLVSCSSDREERAAVLLRAVKTGG
jgi:3-oxoacyl-[acyl-carrier-protein] synthase-1